MATTNHMGRTWLIEHRGWEDDAVMALGAIIFLSSLFFPVTDSMTVVLNTMITGAVIVALGIMEVALLRRWQEALTFLAGLWMIISPSMLGYMDSLHAWHVAFGAIVALIAALQIWQDRHRRFDA